jgi:HSP20 family protein
MPLSSVSPPGLPPFGLERGREPAPVHDKETDAMRYRRLSYRYALILTGNQFQPWDDPRAIDGGRVRFAQTFWRPPADVCESARAIEVTVDLAGVDQDDLDVVLFEDAIIVEGQRRSAIGGPGVTYHIAEIPQGPFRLELTLPAAIDQERIQARYDQGLLHITLPKRSDKDNAR